MPFTIGGFNISHFCLKSSLRSNKSPNLWTSQGQSSHVHEGTIQLEELQRNIDPGGPILKLKLIYTVMQVN